MACGSDTGVPARAEAMAAEHGALVQPLTDRGSYQDFTLPNGLRALVCSDPGAEKAGAAMTVRLLFVNYEEQRVHTSCTCSAVFCTTSTCCAGICCVTKCRDMADARSARAPLHMVQTSTWCCFWLECSVLSTASATNEPCVTPAPCLRSN